MFQRMMDCTVDNLEVVFAYMGDSQVGSSGEYTSFTWMHFFPFWPSMALPSIWKNVFCHSNIGNSRAHDFSGEFGPYGEHTATINSCPVPQDIMQLQRFLGMVNF
jgi:hypothetical protein